MKKALKAQGIYTDRDAFDRVSCFMKIVFDTNVLIAAFITRGVRSDALEHCE